MIRGTAVTFFVLGIVWAGSEAAASEPQPNEALLRMISDLLNDADPQMRAVGYEQVRGADVSGPAATKRFAALLPNMSSEAQAGFLEALGARGDAAARPAVVDMLGSSQDPRVRASCLKALGVLGGVADMPLLADRCAGGTEAERAAARHSLAQLRGEDVNAAIAAALAAAPPAVRIELLDALAARKAKESLPAALRYADDADATVRVAALGAMRALADQNQAPAVVQCLKAARTEDERREAEVTLLTVCGRGGEACVDALLAGLAGAGSPARVALLRALGRCGGAKALNETLARAKDPDAAVRDEAVRVLCEWNHREAAPPLLDMARSGGDLRTRVLALRGCVRLALGDPPDVAMLAEALKLAPRPEEKRLVLGALGNVPSPKTLELAAGCLEDPIVAVEAGAAVVSVAETLSGGDKEQARAGLERVLQRVQDPAVRERAKRAMETLGR
jgi:HEAT repeat protein